MGELIGLLAVFGLLVLILGLMLRGMIPRGTKIKTWSDLHDGRGESRWGIALMGGFAVYEVLNFVVDAVSDGTQGASVSALALVACSAIGASCAFGAAGNTGFRLPAELLGGVAAVLVSMGLISRSWAERDLALLGITGALGLLFGVMLLARGPGKSSGLAWFTILEAVVFFVSPFEVDLRASSPAGWAMSIVIAVVCVGVLALAPWVVLNLFAMGIVLAHGLLVLTGVGDWGKWIFAGCAWICYSLTKRVARKLAW